MKEKRLIVGITKENELIEATLDITKRNKTKNNILCGLNDNGIKTYWINTYIYRDIVDEETGEEKATETLGDPDYWDDIGFIDKDCFLNGFIDFEAVAEHVICNDGWYNTNGEYNYLEEYEGKDYYYDLCGIGGNHFKSLLDEAKVLFISVKKIKRLNELYNQYVQDKKGQEEILKIFNTKVDKKEVIKKWLGDDI